MQGLAQGRSMARQIAGQRLDGWGWAAPDPRHRLVHGVEPGRPLAGSTRMAHGPMPGQETTRGGLGDNARRAAERGGVITLPGAHGGQRGSVRVDDLAGGHGLGGPRQRLDLRSQLQPWPLGLAYPWPKPLPQPPALAPDAAHHVLEVVLESLGSSLQGRVQTAANVGEPGWQHNLLLGSSPLDLGDPPGIHHRQGGPPSVTALCIGAGHLMVQAFPRQSNPCRDGWTSTRAGSGEALGDRARHGRHQGRPRNRLGSWANRMRFGHDVGHLEPCSTARQPMLEVSSERHGRLS
jgi:hypothetical protein